jgi:hypothetical protein
VQLLCELQQSNQRRKRLKRHQRKSMAQGKDPEKGGEHRKSREPGKRKEVACIQKRVHSLGP